MGIRQEIANNPFGTTGNTNSLNYINEDNFSIVPEGNLIWEGELPYYQGVTFPTDAIQAKANRYKTNELLYEQEYSGIISNMLSPRDYTVDVLTNMPILGINNNLPDYNLCTDTWTDFMATNPPSIDGVTDNALKVYNIITNSNFYSIYKQIIKGTLFMYGNYAVKVSTDNNGKILIEPLPLKCWIPFVSPKNVTKIAVNVFFNIYYKGNESKIEFIEYHDTGKIVKKVYNYVKGVIGELEEHEETVAFEHCEMSPIVIFTSNTIGGEVVGVDTYKKWTPSIIATMKTFTRVMIETERLSEIYRKMPTEAMMRDEETGMTNMAQQGVIGYDTTSGNDYKIPEVEIIRPESKLKDAIDVYNLSLERVARDTGLNVTVFRPELLGGNISAKALKASNLKTETKAQSYVQDIVPQLKQLVKTVVAVAGDNVSDNNLTVTISTNFIKDIETDNQIIESRLKTGTISIKDAIKAYDNISDGEAEIKYNELRNKEQDNTLDGVIDNLQNNVNDDLTLTATNGNIKVRENAEEVVNPNLLLPTSLE